MQKNKSLKQDILVVDDVPAICSLLADYFQTKGYRVATAHTANAAFKELAANPFSLVITNLQLERSHSSGGLEVVKRAKQGCRPVPVIVISGGASDEVVSQLALLNADAFLHKPLTLEELRAIAFDLMGQA